MGSVVQGIEARASWDRYMRIEGEAVQGGGVPEQPRACVDRDDVGIPDDGAGCATGGNAELRQTRVDAYAGIKSDQIARKRWIVDKVFTVVATVVATFGTTIGALKVLGYL